MSIKNTKTKKLEIQHLFLILKTSVYEKKMRIWFLKSKKKKKNLYKISHFSKKKKSHFSF